MKQIIFTILSICIAFAVLAQDDLKCYTSDSFGGLFSSNKITAVSIVAQSEKSITLSIEVEGFEEEDEEFILKGTMLNRKTDTRAIKGIVSEKVNIPKGGGSVELTFRFNDKDVRTSKAYVETKYVKFTAVKSGGLDGLLDGIEGLDGLEGLNLSGVELVCDCKKKWRISGSSNPGSVEITVDLIPYGAAQNITP